jgi:hypothetical protein
MARKSKEAIERGNQFSREYYAKNTKACKQMTKAWREANPDKVRQYRKNAWRKRYSEHAAEELARINEWKQRNKSKIALGSSVNVIAEKLAFLEAYGGCCSCCGDERFEFLTGDHVKGNGAALRRAGEKFGYDLYRKLRLQGYPKGEYRILCMNCNFAHGKYGYCPHQFEANREYGISAC